MPSLWVIIKFWYICVAIQLWLSNKNSCNLINAINICASRYNKQWIALFFCLQSSCNREAVERFVSRSDHNKYHSGVGAKLFSSANSLVSSKPPGGDHMACSWWLLCKFILLNTWQFMCCIWFWGLNLFAIVSDTFKWKNKTKLKYNTLEHIRNLNFEKFEALEYPSLPKKIKETYICFPCCW